MPRFDNIGLFWQDLPSSRKRGERQLGPMPEIPETGWLPPTEMPNIRDAPWISLDTETYDPELNTAGAGWARGRGHICGISVAVPGAKWYFPIRHEVEPHLNMDPDMVLRWANWALSNNQPKIGANLYYDIGWLEEEGVEVNGELFDVQYAEPLLDERALSALDVLGMKYLGVGKETDLLKRWAQDYYMSGEKRWRADIYRCPVSLVGAYAEQDAVLPYEILQKQWPLLAERNMIDLFKMECKLIRILIKMRQQGVTVDTEYAERYRDELNGRINVLRNKMAKQIGFEVNINSANELADAFDKLGLPYGRTAPTEANPEGQPSFTQPFLKTVNHEFAKSILNIRELEKVKGTFLEGYILNKQVNGKVFGTFHPLRSDKGGTVTGRFSSSDPNLQNIPVRTDEGKKIRKAFIPDVGHKQIRAPDYSQIEYRMLAHFATGQGSDEVRALYAANPKLDYHDTVGDMIDELTGIRLKRSFVKNVNFGLVYGLGIDALAGQLGVPVSEARNLSKTFHTALPFARATMQATMDEVGGTGICTTILNRQTHFDLWEPNTRGNGKGMGLPYRQAVEEWGYDLTRAYLYKALNYRLQGSAADVMKVALVACAESGVFDYVGYPRLTVHDELVFSDPGGVDDGFAEVKRIMETSQPCKVPLYVSDAIGPTWGDCKDI